MNTNDDAVTMLMIMTMMILHKLVLSYQINIIWDFSYTWKIYLHERGKITVITTEKQVEDVV